MTTAEDIQSILQREANAILNIPISDAFEKAISLIVEQVHRKKGKLVTSGMGESRTDCHEYRNDFLFYRNTFCFSTSQ